MATASVASIALVGSTLGSTPAFASEGQSPTSGTLPLSAASAGAATIRAGLAAAGVVGAANLDPAHTPIARLTANHSTVAPKSPITFTATATLPDGHPDASAPVTLQVTTVRGWETIRSKPLSADGTATFTFHPNYDHNYRLVLPAVTGNSTGTTTTVLNSAMSPNVAVHVKPADIGAAVVAMAAKEKGKRYVFGAEGPNTFDCSGLVKFVYAKFGINLPHHANDMKHYGVRVSAKDAKPGDLVFVFSGSFAHHVAIYAGNGTWWEAPHTGASVRHVKIWSSDIEFRRVR